jgi:phosphate uptake regulator
MRQDLVLAKNVLHSGATVDNYRNYIFRRLCERADIPGKRESDIHLMYASRYLEQIADHALNLAKKLVLFLHEKQGATMPRQLAC